MTSGSQRIRFDKEKDFIRTENKVEADRICKYINIQNAQTRNIFQKKIVTCKHLLFDKT